MTEIAHNVGQDVQLAPVVHCPIQNKDKPLVAGCLCQLLTEKSKDVV